MVQYQVSKLRYLLVLSKGYLMKYKFLFLFYLFSEIVLYTSICPIAWGVPPTTPKIVFASRKNGNLDIYTMNPDGREQIQLTQHRSIDANPKWSPTGEHIIFRNK